MTPALRNVLTAIGTAVALGLLSKMTGLDLADHSQAESNVTHGIRELVMLSQTCMDELHGCMEDCP